MAQDFNTNVVINTNGEAEALETLNNLGSALNDVGGAAEGAEKSSESLRSQLRRLQAELADLDPNTEKFQELSKQTGEIKDKLNDAAEATRANAGPAFETLGNNFGLLTQRLVNLDFEGVGQSLKGIAGSISNVKFGDLANGAKSLASGFKAIGGALLNNPLFLIAAIIVGVGAALFALKDKIAPVKKAFDVLAEGVKFVTGLITSFTDAIGLTTVAADNALEQTQALLDSNVKNANAQRRKLVADAKRNNTSVEDVERQHFENLKKIYQEQLDALDNYVRQGGVLNEDQLKKQQELKAQLEGVVADQYDFETEQLVKARQAQEEADKEAAAKAKERAKQAAEEKKQREKELTATIKQIEEERLQSQLNAEAKELRQNKVKYEELLKKAGDNKELQKQVKEQEEQAKVDIEAKYAKIRAEEKAKADEKTRADAKAAEQQYQDELAELENIAFEAGLTAQQKELRALDEYYFEKIEKARQAGIDTTALEQEYANKTAEIDENYRKEKEAKDKEAAAKEKAIQDAKIQVASDAIGLLIALNDSFSGKDEASRKRAFERNKKLQIAQALISTYQGAAAAYTAAAASPITIGFPAYPFIQAGLAVAAGLAQVNKIRQTQFEGGGGGGSASIPSTGASGGGGQAGTPQSPINTSFLQNRPEQNALQAYVVEGQITDKQEAAQKVRDQSRL
jgi:hypothetical protein